MIWPAETIWQQLAAQLPGITVEVLPEVDSTNTELMRRARQGQADPVLLVAERQTAGRGRLGRTWQGEPGHTLMFSLGLPLAPHDWSGLSLAVGVSLAHSLDPQDQHRVRLKWPNDLWLAQPGGGWAKLAGILIETAVTAHSQERYCVIGVGINLVAPQDPALSTLAVGWQSQDPHATAPSVLAQVAAPLLQDVLRFAQTGFAPLQNAFAARDALLGLPLRLSDSREGEGLGVDATGALRVRTAEGVQAVHSSDISVRPQPIPGQESHP
jgi:BirA family biotin operon repressor/biotin-[acetyl-CoA-carboxylase] ligase